MQFYVVDSDPRKSAEMLPDYALKRVNIREGWQILSDIGHRFGVQFDGQNKPYNPYHPLTRQFSYHQGFAIFLDAIYECCSEYVDRVGKSTPTVQAIADAFGDGTMTKILLAVPSDAAAEARHYLLTRKAKFLTDAEKQKLERI